ncbi:hypothetical protein BJI67_11980 [Acidihalobacter aeolianus]|uniref:Sel1 repeat family protein n=1 Tax=Acidihalobacter aeolianus TaxID=2792603 RepID=A0A1D8K9R8_9GAMM|nr:SEL1-like repeat protein [Acidihalobacter aeolianus]AOV17681.1 hypothetical protein BJI67_11980 [Acidihalobacter aeolianus]
MPFRHGKISPLIFLAGLFRPALANAASADSGISVGLHAEAEHGDATAQEKLEMAYLEKAEKLSISARSRNNGQVVDLFRNAMYWFGKSADQGYYDAQLHLGDAYAKDLGVPRDKTKAAYWYRKAIDGVKKAVQEGIERDEYLQQRDDLSH